MKEAAKPATTESLEEKAANLQKQMEAVLEEQAKLPEAAAKAEEEAAAAAAESATKEEVEGYHMQLEMEKSYLTALEGMTGHAVELRRAQHVETITWFKHRITDLKKPADRVKSLTVGAGTAEKHLHAAGEKLEVSKLALAAA